MSLKIIKRISLDFTRKAPLEYIFVKTGDKNSRILDIIPLNSGEIYTIPDGARATFAVKKPDGTEILDCAEINAENGHILVTLSDQALAVKGVASCEVGLFGPSGEYLSSQHFYMKADEHLLDGVTSSSEYEALIVAMLAADQKVRDIEAAATKAGLKDAVVVNGEVRYPSEGLEYAVVSVNDVLGFGVTGIGTCTDTDIVIPPTYNGFPVLSLEDHALTANSNITSVVIPESVKKIGSGALDFCTHLEKITCLAQTPPMAVIGNTYLFYMMSGTVYVPKNSLDAYKTASGWSSRTKTMYPIETIETLAAWIKSEQNARAEADSNLQNNINNVHNTLTDRLVTVDSKVGTHGVLTNLDVGIDTGLGNFVEVHLLMTHNGYFEVCTASMFNWGVNAANIRLTDNKSFSVPVTISGGIMTLHMSQLTTLDNTYGYTYVGRMFIKTV